MEKLRNRMAFLAVAGFALTMIGLTPTRLNAQTRHDDCLSVTSEYLPGMSLKNVCDAPIDVKWCHMTRAGTNVGCEVERPLDPNHFVSTGVCAGCQWKVNFEVFLSSDHAEENFSSDAYMLANLRNH